jgi:hypothetical protein
MNRILLSVGVAAYTFSMACLWAAYTPVPQ